ncbi:MAG: polyprenyl synthetase family protein [Ignavibacterium sp.]|nr:polyprenyl synthetase family protein [Ignavibacterium sp.]MCX7610031.1 polyprenyl synthetase family protein [Ignavibacterium sp.]MDW8375039.1 polyprenyl synthetase family protein [Ignavibacteriales bacterium]
MRNKEKKYAKLYERERNKINEKLFNALKNRKPESLYKPSDYILSNSGKRLRPILVLFSAKATGGNFKSVYNAALSVEMLHNFTLIHDDIMDNADLRRGKKTLHKLYDLNTAILAGDSLLSIAYEYLLKDCKINAREAVSAFTQGLIEVCEGQSLDTEFEKRFEVSLDEYLVMIRKKTAALAMMCCKLGAILSNAKKSDVEALANYGLNLGIAFQIQDDLLDIMGDEKEIGKTVGGDLIVGKKTFLFIKAFEKAKGTYKKDLLKMIKNKGISPDKVEYFKEMFIKLGVIDDAKYEIKNYTDKALKSISSLTNKDEIGFFIWLADSLIERNK